MRGQTYYLSKATNRLSSNLRLKLMDKLLRVPIGYYNERRTGGIQSILLNDVNVYQNAIGIIRDSIQGPMQAVTAFITIFIIQWRIAAVALFLVPFIAMIIERNHRKMRAAQTVVQENLAEVSANTIEVLNGVRVVKAFNAEANIRSNYDGLIEKTFASQMRATKVTAYLRPLT